MTLRSGKKLSTPLIIDEDEEQEVDDTIQEPILEDEPKILEKEVKVKESTFSSKSSNPLPFVPNTLTYSQRFKKKEIDS